MAMGFEVVLFATGGIFAASAVAGVAFLAKAIKRQKHELSNQ